MFAIPIPAISIALIETNDKNCEKLLIILFNPLAEFSGYLSLTFSASPRGHRWDGGRVKVLTKKNVRVRDPPDTRVGHHQVGEPLVQHADLLHGGGEEVCSIQSGQEPRPECSVEKQLRT